MSTTVRAPSSRSPRSGPGTNTSEASLLQELKPALRVVFVYVGVLTLAVAAGLLPEPAESTRLTRILLVAAPLGSLLAALRSARELPRQAANAWALIALAAAFAALAQAAELTAAPGVMGFGTAAASTLSYAFLLSALTLMLHGRERGRTTEIVLDAALLASTVSVVVLQWSPAVATAVQGEALSTAVRFALITIPALALTTAALAVVAGTVRASARATRLPIASGVGLLAVAALPVGAGRALAAEADGLPALAFIAGWGLLAVAAQMRRVAVAHDVAGALAGGLQLRQLMPPAVAMVMAAVAVDAMLRPAARTTTPLALGLLGTILALRCAQLVRSTRKLPAQRRQLAQTRALVDLSRALAGTNDLDETLALMTRWTCHLLNAHAAGVELLDEESNTLEFRAAYGLPPSVIGVKVPVDASFSGLVVKEGRPLATNDPERERGGSRALPKIEHSTLAAAPLRFRTRLLGALSCVGTHEFTSQDLALLGALADQAAVAIENARMFHQVRVLSLTDPLTGLANRRQLEREVGREFAAARRGRRVVGVMFDLDEFKAYNDTHGHVAGDAALRAFARALAGETRAMNLAARYGGDEFFVLLADANEAGANVFVQRVRDRFDGEMTKLGRGLMHVSAGVAEYRPSMPSPESMIEAADRALYASKGERRRAPHAPVQEV